MTRMRLYAQRSEQVCFVLQKYPHIRSLHLYRVSLYFSQFEDMGKLPNLRHIALYQLRSAEEAEQPLLEGKPGARRSAFQFLHKLTSLELGGHSQAAVTPDEVQGILHLTNLQHITFTRDVPVPYTILLELTSLTALEVEQLEPGTYGLTRLQRLSLLPHNHFAPFSEALSSLQALTALAVGSVPRDYRGISCRDLAKLTVLSNLQKLTLTGLMGDLRDPGHAYNLHRRAQVWMDLASFTTVRHLELIDVCHTYSAFTNLAKMTQLTCLTFFPVCPVDLEGLDNELAALSTLINLDVLKCHFSNHQRDQNYNCVVDSLLVPDIGCVLKVTLPQSASMSVFSIASERLEHSEYDQSWDYRGTLYT